MTAFIAWSGCCFVVQSASLVPEELHGSQTRARNNEGIWDALAHEVLLKDRNRQHVEMEEGSAFGRRSCDEHVDGGVATLYGVRSAGRCDLLIARTPQVLPTWRPSFGTSGDSEST